MGNGASSAWQGKRMNAGSCALPEEALEAGCVPAGWLPSVLERAGGLGPMQQVGGHVPDHGHVLGCMAAAQAGEVVPEHHVQDPVQAVLDAPMIADRLGEGGGIELGGGEIAAPLE